MQTKQVCKCFAPTVLVLFPYFSLEMFRSYYFYIIVWKCCSPIISILVWKCFAPIISILVWNFVAPITYFHTSLELFCSYYFHTSLEMFHSKRIIVRLETKNCLSRGSAWRPSDYETRALPQTNRKLLYTNVAPIDSNKHAAQPGLAWTKTFQTDVEIFHLWCEQFFFFSVEIFLHWCENFSSVVWIFFVFYSYPTYDRSNKFPHQR